MKNQFATFMRDQDFRSAAHLIIEATLYVHVPKNVNLNIEIRQEKEIKYWTNQIKNSYDQINNTYSEFPFEKFWTAVITNPELSEKPNFKIPDLILSKARTEYDNFMNRIKIEQYEQIFETTTLSVNTTLQGVVDAALKI